MNKAKHLAGVVWIGAMACAGAVCAEDLVRWVNPLVGTVNEGNTFPGCCRPFGLVQPSPDTGTRVWCSGYKHTDTTIRGFSQTHLNGTGRPAMGDILLMPFAGDSPQDGDYSSPFRKETQTCSPDYYAVTLDGCGVRCEATASERVAWWRFTYPAGGPKRLLVDAAAMLMQGWNLKLGPRVPESSYALTDDRQGIDGYRLGRGWTLYRLYYAVRFSRPYAAIRRLPSDPFDGKGDRFEVTFEGDGPVEVRVALSGTSEAGARRNLSAEADGQTFETVRAANRAAWNEILSRAQVVAETGKVKVRGEGEDKGEQRTEGLLGKVKANWYTAIYHLCIQPNVQSDADGSYRTADDRIARTAGRHYSTFSLWDTFRAAHPLYTFLVPERVGDFVASMLATGREHGHLPMWTMYGHEDHGMIGIHSIPVIVDAWAKGFRRFDADEALTLMVQSMTNNDGENPVNCWNAYWENGYFPYEPGVFDQHLSPGGSVSRTLEFAYDWWCIARFAEMTGREKTRREAQRWADCWRNVFDEKVGFARPRAPKTSGGGWREPFDPAQARVPGAFWSDYTEANSWIYTWHVFQDPMGLAEKMGGRDKALAKLDAFFDAPPPKARKDGGNNDEGGVGADGRIRDGQVGQYWHGNEPSHHIAYFYTLLGRPDKTAELVRRLCRDAYRPVPDGLCGNDDCGQMSAWYLFSMMGFYPFNPCGDGYVIGAPQVARVELRVPSGKLKSKVEVEERTDKFRSSTSNFNSFTVVAKGLSDENRHVKSVTLNGKPVTDWKIRHEDIVRGGELVFEMGK